MNFGQFEENTTPIEMPQQTVFQNKAFALKRENIIRRCAPLFPVKFFNNLV